MLITTIPAMACLLLMRRPAGAQGGDGHVIMD
jgi:hypothetical protein